MFLSKIFILFRVLIVLSVAPSMLSLVKTFFFLGKEKGMSSKTSVVQDQSSKFYTNKTRGSDQIEQHLEKRECVDTQKSSVHNKPFLSSLKRNILYKTSSSNSSFKDYQESSTLENESTSSKEDVSCN